MDAFYASVEQRDNPSLRGKPVAVGGDPTAARRRRGGQLRSAHVRRPLGDPDGAGGAPLPVARHRPARLPEVPRGLAAGLRDLREVTPLVEPLSLDEAYLDVTENSWGEPLGVNVARRLKERIRDATQLTASAGVAPNKFLAKIASGWKKPDGLTVVAPGARREVPAGPAGRRACGASGRSPPSGCASTASRSSPTCARSRRPSSKRSSAAWRRG